MARSCYIVPVQRLSMPAVLMVTGQESAPCPQRDDDVDAEADDLLMQMHDEMTATTTTMPPPPSPRRRRRRTRTRRGRRRRPRRFCLFSVVVFVCSFAPAFVLFVCWFVCLFWFGLVCFVLFRFVRLFVCLFVCVCVCLFVCLFVFVVVVAVVAPVAALVVFLFLLVACQFVLWPVLCGFCFVIVVVVPLCSTSPPAETRLTVYRRLSICRRVKSYAAR